MRVGTALTLIAVGLILNQAVTATVPVLDLQVAGAILFYIGVLGLAVTLVMDELDRRRRRGPRRPPPDRFEPRRREPPPDPHEQRTRVLPRQRDRY